MKRLPSQYELRRLFDYDSNTGQLIWRERSLDDFVSQQTCNVWNAKNAGRSAGCVDASGYVRIAINRARYYAHRLVWVWCRGAIADGLNIDHADGNRANNNITNLNLATITDNNRNMRLRSDNRSGVAGVDWCKKESKWRARGRLYGREQHLGFFDVLEAAAAAAAAFRVSLGYSDRHIGGIS